MVALFRIEDLKQGQILIDGIDIARVSLNLLRNKLCIIPQDPVMFSASVRFNLDPFDEHSDEEVWEVLTSVNMREHVLSLPNKLQEMVAEGGDNFSAGQRQVSFAQLQLLGVAVRQSRMDCAHYTALASVRLSYMS
jgi:ABC-type multidrug transport system fused ATPase/permease subunit